MRDRNIVTEPNFRKSPHKSGIFFKSCEVKWILKPKVTHFSSARQSWVAWLSEQRGESDALNGGRLDGWIRQRRRRRREDGVSLRSTTARHCSSQMPRSRLTLRRQRAHYPHCQNVSCIQFSPRGDPTAEFDPPADWIRSPTVFCIFMPSQPVLHQRHYVFALSVANSISSSVRSVPNVVFRFATILNRSR